jgi:hypothetical protein
MTTSIPTATAPSARFLSLPATLQLDAVVSGANGLAYLLGASLLDDVLGVQASSIRPVGVFVLVYAVVVGAVGFRRPVNRRAATVVVGGNVLWATESLVVAATDLGTPTATGTAWIVAQALLVAGLASLQWSALRRSRAERG